MVMEILKVIVMVCNISALEDNSSNWTEFKKAEKLQRSCRIYYYDCLRSNGGIGIVTMESFMACDKKKSL